MCAEPRPFIIQYQVSRIPHLFLKHRANNMCEWFAHFEKQRAFTPFPVFYFYLSWQSHFFFRPGQSTNRPPSPAASSVWWIFNIVGTEKLRQRKYFPEVIKGCMVSTVFVFCSELGTISAESAIVFLETRRCAFTLGILFPLFSKVSLKETKLHENVLQSSNSNHTFDYLPNILAAREL